MQTTILTCDTCGRVIIGDETDAMMGVAIQQEEPYIINHDDLKEEYEICEDCYGKIIAVLKNN